MAFLDEKLMVKKMSKPLLKRMGLCMREELRRRYGGTKENYRKNVYKIKNG